MLTSAESISKPKVITDIRITLASNFHQTYSRPHETQRENNPYALNTADTKATSLNIDKITEAAMDRPSSSKSGMPRVHAIHTRD